MSQSITIADIIEIAGRFLVVAVTPGQGPNHPCGVFSEGTQAEANLVGLGFSFDPATNRYYR